MSLAWESVPAAPAGAETPAAPCINPPDLNYHPRKETPMHLTHTALFASDLERMRDFFTTYFDCTAGELYHNAATGFRSYFLTFSGGGILELMSMPGIAAPDATRRCGLDHIAICVGSPRQVDDLTARLSDDGYEILSPPRTTGDGYYESCVAAPDGLRVELTA